MNRIAMVIGSWGSYNECNERALGSKWLDFDDYDDWDEIIEELEKEGFELDGIDEELFVQDIEGIPTDSEDWDNTHPKEIFELIKSSGVLNDNYKHEIMEAYCEVRSFDEWADLVERYGENWDDDIIFYKGQDMYDVVGGKRRACVNWTEAKLMRPDHVHYLPEGYILQGNLLYQALINAYNDYVSH